MRHRFFILALSTLPFLPVAASDPVLTGAVSGSKGKPLENARVEVVGGEAAAVTDKQGRFELSGVTPPLDLRITHQRFTPSTIRVDALEGPLEIVLQPTQLEERVAVSATRGEQSFLPISVSTTVTQPDDDAAPPSSLTEMVSKLPSVSENGQGGLFQTYSIRGVSRQRVLTLVSGMRILGERRAGVSASFIDPRLIDSAEVVRGPASTYYGSGALGGVVQLFPRGFDDFAVEGGYQAQGNENYQLFGWGNGGWSVALARRDAGDAETPDGETLNSAFTQTSATLARRWATSCWSYAVEAVASRGTDIGKPNTDFPERTTVYPEEEHLLLRFSARSDKDWRADAWIHPNRLETSVEESDLASDLDNRAFDLGFSGQKGFEVGEKISLQAGGNYFGRRGVTAEETLQVPSQGTTEVLLPLDDAEEDELGLYGAVEWKPKSLAVVAGARLSGLRQRNAARPRIDDDGLTGFAGVVVPLHSRLELAANLGSALRFPSLSERFFSGLTGAGGVIGNPDLVAERSLNVDLGLRWHGNRLFIGGYVFRNRIEDYIERIEIEPDVLTFVNLTSGTIEGIELEGLLRPDDHWSLAFGAHAMEGRSRQGQALADIPADRVFLTPGWRRGKWSAELRWEYRFKKTDPGPREKPIPSADLVSAALRYAMDNGLTLKLAGSNLLDETYFNSADRNTANSPGRSVGVALHWSRPARRNGA